MISASTRRSRETTSQYVRWLVMERRFNNDSTIVLCHVIKTCQQIRFVEILFSLRWYVELILQGWTLSLYSNSSVVYSEEEPALQCRRQLRAGLIAIEAWFGGYCGSPGLGGLRTAGLSPWAGLLDYEDTRLKTPSRVRMGLYLAWKAS